MLEVSDEHKVLEINEFEPEGVYRTIEPRYNEDKVDTILFNQTDPTVIIDGLESITVASAESNIYLLDIFGYESGYLWIKREGLEEIAEDLFTDQDEIPRYLLETGRDRIPKWMPDEYEEPKSLTCERCGDSEIPAKDIRTPGRTGDRETKRYCPSCWDEVQD